ncbi:hypothetical protein [Salinigranum sp. GCM10025319]|uniref:hypothetical protein n=1 Tax=Salinigranum sp. GCM10025319 TaxID=3252687 RepID=UPI003618761C
MTSNPTPTPTPNAEGLNHRDRAIRCLSEAAYADAGDAYTLAAYGGLAGLEGRRREAFDPDARGWVGYPLAALVLAGVCYRIAELDGRARNRAGQGILVVGDQRDHVLDHPVERAACHEWVGDFRAVAGDADRAAAAYDRAADGYAAAEPDSPAEWTTRPLLQAGTDALLQLSRPDDLDWGDLHGSSGSDALGHRARFKRSRLRSLLHARIDDGRLFAPRGSTEYGVDDFRCPACGANDVNYVAETVLCLRCNAGVDRA